MAENKQLNKDKKVTIPSNLKKKANSSLKANLSEDLKASFSATDDDNLSLKIEGLKASDTKEDSTLDKIDKDNYFNVDDPDSIPLKTTLKDEDVPNMPGAILRHAREILGLSQRQIAQKLKLRVNTISDIEHDRLNQSTAAAFTRHHYYNYAKLVNIDPKTVVELYDNNVAMVTEAIVNNATPVKKNRSYLYSLLIIAFIIISTALYLVVDSSKSDSDKDTMEIVLEANNNEVLLEDDTKSKANDTIVIDESIDTKDTVVSVDKNTVMAQAQAEALGTNTLDASNLEHEILKDQRPSNKPLMTHQSQKAQIKDTNKAQIKDSNKAQSVVAYNKAIEAKSDTYNKDLKDSVKNNDKTQSAQNDKIKVQDEPKKEIKVALVSNPKDISSSAKLVNRQGLGSLNEASIRVLDDAYIIARANGRVIKQGAFKKGDVIKVYGVPPIEVSVSNSKAILVNYMGGRVTVPAQVQVKFVLPQR